LVVGQNLDASIFSCVRRELCPTLEFDIPTGLESSFTGFPALKRWAKLVSPYRADHLASPVGPNKME